MYEFAFIYKCLSKNQNTTHLIESFMYKYEFNISIIYDLIHEKKKIFSSTSYFRRRIILGSYI